MLFPIKDYNPTRKTAYITIIFIMMNVSVFIFQNFNSQYSEKVKIRNGSEKLQLNIVKYGLIPKEITSGDQIKIKVAEDRYKNPYYLSRELSPFLSFFTSMFMHGSFMHLFGNMIFLWIFGNNIEERLGKFVFIVFYLLAGVIASSVHILFNWNSVIPVIGASGAVSGIMGAYLFLYPKAKVKTFVFILFIITFIDIPASVFLIIWFVMQFTYKSGDGVAFLAHIGGFIFGFIAIQWLSKQRKKTIKIEEVL